MSEVLDRIVATREDAHEAAKAAYAVARAAIDNGKPARIVAQEHEQDRTLRQNRFYWGPCLKEISQQARIGGVQYIDEAWHELFRRMFLGHEITKTYVAGKARPIIVRRLMSTAKLKVKPFGEYLDKVQAYAATDLGVEFSVLRWQDYA